MVVCAGFLLKESHELGGHHFGNGCGLDRQFDEVDTGEQFRPAWGAALPD